MKPELQQYQVEPGAFWQTLPLMGIVAYLMPKCNIENYLKVQ